MKLSVFRGGFTKEAARAVTAASIRDLQRLVHTSFIQHLPSGRYTIHELMRQYAEIRLVATGEREYSQESHATYFIKLLEPMKKTVPHSSYDNDLLKAINDDFENIRLAWEFCVRKKMMGGLNILLSGIWLFMDKYGRSQEGIELLKPSVTVFNEKRK